jgi:hypothetical protein
MARYFTTRNASRPFKAGGLAFEFEPYEQTGGGSWLGVLAVEEPAASILAGKFTGIIIEIDVDAYEAIKKKIQEARQQLRGNPGARAAATPEPACHSCGKNGYQVRR